jgi:hypothetical protein
MGTCPGRARHPQLLVSPNHLTKEPLGKFVAAQFKVRRDVTKDSGQGPDAKGIVLWNGDVVFAVLLSGQAQVAAGLTSDLIAKLAEGVREIVPRKVTGKPHTAITSSRT